MRRYSVILTPDPEGGYAVRVPALPGCNTQGDTLSDALANAQGAVELCLETLKEMGKPLPEDTEPTQAVIITVAAQLGALLHAYR